MNPDKPAGKACHAIGLAKAETASPYQLLDELVHALSVYWVGRDGGPSPTVAGAEKVGGQGTAAPYQ